MKHLMPRNDFHVEKELDELKHKFFVDLYHDGVTWNLVLTDHDDKSIGRTFANAIIILKRQVLECYNQPKNVQSMKELSIAEKAKRYDEAIKKLEDIKTGKCQKTFIFTEGLFEHIFPELRDSEDEKIRKAIIEFFELQDDNTTYSFIPKKDILAWLEKHKYTEKDLDKAYECADKVQYRRGYEDAKKEIEKQGKQKLQSKSTLEAWKEMRSEVYAQASGNRHEPNCSDDKTKMFSLSDIDEIIEKISEQKPADKVEQEYHCNGVREPKEATGVLKQLINEQKFDWSEDDNKLLTYILVTMKSYITRDKVAEVENWLKSLKDRVKPLSTQEWSEEDKVKINRIVAFLENLNLEYLNAAGNDILLKDIEWLKSLKERYI